MSDRTYWMVHCPQHGPPTAIHRDPETARAEAKRLARLNPDRAFYVLEAVEAFVKVDVRRLDLRRPYSEDDDELPF